MNFLITHKNDLDEIVFENRNKQYGAYALRKSYDEHLIKATVSSFGLLVFCGISMYAISLFKPEIQPIMETVKSVAINHTLSSKLTIVPDEELLSSPKATRNLDNMRYQIVRDQHVSRALTTPPNPERALNPKGDEQQSIGNSETGTSLITDGTGEANEIETTTPYATFVTDMPSFDGGAEAMAKFIRKELMYPADALQYEKEGKVVVSFIVQTDGSITDVAVVKGFGFGSEEEAKRVIERMPKWNPGKQNGKLVPVKFVLSLHFQLQ